MEHEGPSAVRKVLLWWFEWPGNPYVSVSVAVDFDASRRYLAALADGARAPVSVHHLVTAAITRVLSEFPVANARIVGGRITREPHVGVAMPVNLLGHDAGRRREVGAVFVDHASALSLRAIAEATQRVVAQERKGAPANPLVRHLLGLVERAPAGVVARGLDALHFLTRRPAVARLLYKQVPFTTVLTNAGAPFTLREGLLLRAAAFEIPQRLIHVGTLWALSAVQDEVFAVGGVPCVRPALPVTLVFDHRLFDGVVAGRLLVRLGEILADPAAVFGPDGDRPVGA